MQRRSLLEYLENFRGMRRDTAYAQRQGYRTVRWSYGEVVDAACRFARELEARQVQPGDRVLLWGENSAEWVAAFFGCLLRGVVAVPMDPSSPADFLQRVASQVDAKLLVCSADAADAVPSVPSCALKTLPQALQMHSSAPYPSPEVTRATPAEIIFTSGATADPKGVVLTHGNLLASLEPLEAAFAAYRRYERLVHTLRFLNLLPLSHVFGQVMGMFVPQLLGGTVVFQDSLSPAETLRAIRRERVSVLVAVPRMLESLKDKMERDIAAEGWLPAFQRHWEAAAGESFLRRFWRFRRLHRRLGWKFWAFISGGAALDEETETFWSRVGFAVIQGYGLTETASLVAVNHPFHTERRSIGKTLPGRELRLDASGEILVRGESVAASYWQGRQLAPVAGEDGWLRTGDLGGLDAQGNLFFKGRKKNVLVTPEGMNIYPQDLEAALRRQPEVHDCVVVGLPRNGNEEPCAVLLLRPGGGDPETIVRRANQSLAEHQRMRRWFRWPADDFPRTATQKPRTHLIRQRVLEGTGESAITKTENPLAALIARLTARPAEGLSSEALSAQSPPAHLEADLNLTSLERVELLSALEERYQTDIDERSFSAVTTVAELENMLRQTAPPAARFHYPRWAQRWPVSWLRFAVYYLLTWPATLLLGYPRIIGRENLRGVRGPVLLISNHVTEIDAALLLAALPWRWRHKVAVAMHGERLEAMRHPPAGTGLFRRALQKTAWALLTSLFNVFPLPQQSGFRESFAFAGEAADRGYSVLVFPEGQITQDGQVAPFRAGIGLLVQKTNLPVVPLRIDGLFELKQAGRKWARPGAITITIGAPVQPDPQADPQEIAAQLQRAVVL